jgi:hypothetical protein
MKYSRRNVLISVVLIQTHDITDPLSRSILCGKASNHVCLMHLGKPCLPTQKSSSEWSIAVSVCLKVICKVSHIKVGWEQERRVGAMAFTGTVAH